jgi:hypothetical protein
MSRINFPRQYAKYKKSFPFSIYSSILLSKYSQEVKRGAA